MTLLRFVSVLFCIGIVKIATAQSGIGVIPTNADYALHIKTSSSAQDPLRLEGLRAGTAETSVLVTDANGRLSYRPAADLFSGGSGSSLWGENNGDISPVSNRSVGIGQANVDNSLILGITGNQRMSNSSQIQFSDNQNYIYAQSANHFYFVGREHVSFRNRNNSSDILTVRANNSRVGLFNPNPNVDFEVSGTQRMTSDERLEFRDGTNYINSPGSNNNWYFHGQQYVVFRDRNDAVDILTIQANTDRVGILNRNPAVDFEVSGTQRMTNDEQLQFGSTMNYIYARNNQDLRIHGFTETNFMSRGEAEVLMNIDANTRRVGIRTNDPDAILHVEENNSLTLGGGGGGVARFGDGTYVGVSQNQIGAYNGNATDPLHLQQYGNSLVLGASNPATSLLDARGSARIGVLPSVTTDEYVVTANAAGDLRTMNVSSAQALLGDDLGNHTTTQDLLVSQKTVINFGDTDASIYRSENDLEIVNNDEDINLRASNIYVRNQSEVSVAKFDGNSRRVGLGVEISPDATVHIDPANSDFPIRIEDIPIAQGGGQYRRLIINDNGYVYRSRNTVSQNGIVGNGPSGNNFKERHPILSRISKPTGGTSPASQDFNEFESSQTGSLSIEDISNYFPEAVNVSGVGLSIEQNELASILFTAVQELSAENANLQAELVKTQQMQQAALESLEAKLNLLSKQVELVAPATRLVND